MPTAAESVAEWIANGDVHAVLKIQDANVVALPRLPGTLLNLACFGCAALAAFPRLPATLRTLCCRDCPALRHIPRLPATLRTLCCSDCPALRHIPLLPATLERLYWYGGALTHLPPLSAALALLKSDRAVPDVCPQRLLVNNAVYWRKRVAEQHATDRRRVAASLPPLALLFV